MRPTVRVPARITTAQISVSCLEVRRRHPQARAPDPPAPEDMRCFVVCPSVHLRSSPFTSPSPTALRRRVRVQPRRPPARALLNDDGPTHDAQHSHRDHPHQHDREATLLSAQQLDAYFEAEDSSYQPKLVSALWLALRNFRAELSELRIAIARVIGVLPPQKFVPPDCLNFTLSNQLLLQRERRREAEEPPVQCSPFVNFLYVFMCRLLDFVFENRPIPRFWVLETVARMPYFAYSSCLHLYATLGWFRSPTLMNMHHAEELNEAYHLAVMESLGGDKRWSVSFTSSPTYPRLLMLLSDECPVSHISFFKPSFVPACDL